MSKVIIVIRENGILDAAYQTDDCVEVEVLKRGRDDSAIDALETLGEEVELNS